METKKPLILIVEDQKINRDILKGILHRDYDVLEATNGQEALEIVRKDPGIAAILLDLLMPVMDGYAATAAIRQSPHPSAQSIPIIAMTADAYDEDIKKCLAAGMNGHLAKPIDPSRLFQTLAKYIT